MEYMYKNRNTTVISSEEGENIIAGLVTDFMGELTLSWSFDGCT